MKKRLGNFSLLSGLICFIIFFPSSSFGLDYAYFFFGGDLFVGSWLPVKTRAQIKQGKTGFVWEKVPGKSRPGCRE